MRRGTFIQSRVLFTVAAAMLAACGVAASDPPQVSVEFLSEYTLPPGMRFQGACVGGLSAIAYDAANDRYFALSDARRDARLFTLEVDLGEGPEGSPEIAAVKLGSVVKLLTREGEPYGDGRVDPEGLVLVSDGEAFISSEGDAAKSVPPFVDRIDVGDGSYLQSAAIPLAFRPRHDGDVQVRGVRPNLGFESLALSPDRRNLYVASESSLAQDTPDAEKIPAGTMLYSRVLHYRLEEVPRLVSQALYPLEQPEGEVVVHGLVELQALDDDGRLLAMERTFGFDVGMIVKLFEIDLGVTAEEVDRSTLSPAAAEMPVLEKRQVFDFAELPVTLDNFEGLTLGPTLADGGESLLVLGDNNNVDCQPTLNPVRMRPTKLLLFRLLR
ncbi:MAG: esterase-like activity of phytase family protein [Thermoanaerobaculia bacterium]